jgi:pantoate--beta-alanine ligase
MAQLTDSPVDVVWAPLAREMYPQIAVAAPGGGDLRLAVPFRSFVDLADIDAGSPEGAARPGFFRGVATVVTKLFNAVQPTHAVFGQKDGIQCIVVRTLVRELNLPLHVAIAPTMREADGLAMSSRNVYLTPPQRKVAGVLHEALQMVRRALDEPEGRAVVGEAHARREALLKAAQGDNVNADRAAQLAAVASRGGAAAAAAGAAAEGPLHPYLAAALSRARAHVLAASQGHFSEVQYLAFSCGATGRPIADLAASYARGGAVLLSVAAKIGATRLLDNLVLLGDVNDLGTLS